LQVLKAMQAVAQGIVGTGYHFPLQTAEQVTIDPVNVLTATMADGPLYVIEPTPEGTRQFWPAMQLQNAFRGTITGRMDVSDIVDPLARATTWEHLAADLEKAFAVDVTLGGLVYDLRLLEPQPFVGVGSPVVILVQPWEARVHRTYGAP
jgi:hypothetical protein